MRNGIRWASAAALLAVVTAFGGVSPTLAKAAPTGSLYLVQGLPEATVSVSVDGTQEATNVEPKDIVGPLQLSPGRHVLMFSAAGSRWTMKTSVTVDRDQSVDVVLHRPADVDGDPVVTVYRNPTAPVAAGKGRVVVAHTAVVPPADITVNGDVLFSNIANGEFATADVPGGSYEVSVVPTGASGDPLLGPMDLQVETQTLTQVFAIGEPQSGSMDVIVQQLPLSKAGSAAPTVIDTGSAGLVSDWPIVDEQGSADGSGLGLAGSLVVAAGGVLILGLCVWPRGARRLARGLGGRITRGA